MLVYLTDRWVTRKLATLISVPAASFTRIWWRSISHAARTQSSIIRKSNVLTATPKKTANRSISWDWFPTVVYTAHWNTCSNWRISPKNTESTKHMFIALWTVATRTREAVKALSNSWKITCKQQAERSLPSSAVTMQWTATNVGNA